MASPLVEVARLFLRLGLTSFGGPAAHTAFIRDEVVRRRRWLTDAEFLDLVAATNLIPGPNSTELAMHIGLRRAGLIGLLVAGASFIVPAFLMVLAIAVGYARYGATPDVTWLLAGVTPVVVAIIGDALGQMIAVTVRTPTAGLFLVLSAAASLLGAHELLVLLLSALLMLGLRRSRGNLRGVGSLALSAAGAGTSLVAGGVAPAAVAVPVSLTSMTLFFLKVGSVLFGSGYVLIAFLEADLVQRWQWLTPRQLLDAVAVGQFTPGPLFTTATFVGYLLGDLPGAVLATAGIFAPGFVFVAVTAPFIERLRSSPSLSALLDGVVLASLGLMTAVTVTLARQALASPARVLLAVLAVAVLLWRRPNTAWLVVGGGLVGWLASGL